MTEIEKQITEIKHNFNEISERIRSAANRIGRNEDEIRLVVVTKNRPIEIVQAAVAAGAQDLGENYPEESLAKIKALQDVPALKWHMIGHLQSRKAKLVTNYFDMMHSLDSVHLASKLERLLAEQDKILPVLLEFNVGEEPSKYGWPASGNEHWDSLLDPIEQIFCMPHLSVKGLMTMPPYFDDPEKARPYFLKLRSLREYIVEHIPGNPLETLSMGTSGDFEVAIEEGATIVRIGEAILGPRPK